MSLELPTPFSGGNSGWGSGWGGGNYNQYAQMAGGLGGIGSALASMFMTQNPADAASPWLSQIPDALKQYLSPYINQGQQTFGELNNYINRGNTAGDMALGQYGALANNPAGVMNQIGGTFHQSPGYNWQVNQALGAANRAAAAGGMAGSPAEQQQIAGTANQLANQDYYNYLGHALGLYGTGLQGLQGISNTGASIGQNIYGSGANAASNLADSLSSYYMSQGNLAYAGAQNQNQNDVGGLGELIDGIGSIASMFM